MSSIRFNRRHLALAALLLACQPFQASWAAATDIANAPLFTSSDTTVHSNIMFYIDDSGSMGQDNMPDDSPMAGSGMYGYKSYQCNGVAYNPNVTYVPPVDYDGTFFANSGTVPAATFTRAYTNFFGTAAHYPLWGSTDRPYPRSYDAATINLNTSMGAYYYKYTGQQTALNYAYTATAALDRTTTFYKECTSLETAPTSLSAAQTAGTAPGNSVFQLVWVRDESDAQKLNYANWYSYYRTRMLMMKTSTGLAFLNVDSKYRVGFNSINNTTTNPATYNGANTSFLDPKEFDTTQKQKFYKDLYSVNPIYGTPLRGALAQAGQYYAHMALGQTTDPIQYSCQKNFLILSTDGYWNTGGESTTAPKWGPYQLDNSTNVGEQDGDPTPRPMRDGDGSRAVTTKTWTGTYLVDTVTKNDVKRTWQTTYQTTYKLQKTGYTRNAYSTTNAAVNISSIGRCASLVSGKCTITVTTASAHGLATGGTATIASVVSGTPNTYNGTFTVTVTSPTVFTYTLTAIPGAVTSLGNANCPAGKVGLLTQAQTGVSLQDYVDSGLYTYAQTNPKITTTTKRWTSNYTEVITTLNGIVTSDTTTNTKYAVDNSFTPLISVADLPPLNTSPLPTPTVTLQSSGPATGSTASITWSNSGSNVRSSCVTAAPSPNPSTAGGTISSGTKVNINPAVVGTIPTTPTTTGSPGATYGTTTSAAYNLPVVQTTPPTPGPVPLVSNLQVGDPVLSGKSVDTLSDLAMYYYQTDLRNASLGNCTGALGTDVCFDNVGGSSADLTVRDNYTTQHMTTFTLGLGNNGSLIYDPNYLTQVTGDYVNLKNGLKNWPIPTGNGTNIDDLWHAAVTGRGQYFSASDPTSLIQSLKTALDAIKAITGTASAAATSTLQPVQGDNDIYVAKFKSALWFGDVLSYKINPDTGAVASVNDYTWSAQAVLDTLVQNYGASARTIYYAKPSGSSSSLSAFTYDNLDSNTKSYFDNFCSDSNKRGAGNTTHPLQCAYASSTSLGYANSGQNLVNYLRGDSSYAYNSVYRAREHLLGDIINASPLFVGQPAFRYTDAGYTTFAQTSRTNVVYAAANDGMLHAFDRSTGTEKWAYIPTDVLPKLYKLADINYSSNHMYLVDGSPVAGDVFDGASSSWKSIVVAGLGSGGNSYYALDVTVPEHPKLLWEFREKDLGLSYGNPIITKLSDGTWVVLLTSGYNNTSNGGDGNGHLYVVNAMTGALMSDSSGHSMKYDTVVNGAPVGSSSTPSGLAKINNYVELDTDNTTKVVYGGDLLGNVWRFDISSQVRPYLQAMRLAQLQANNIPQPIATKMSLAQIAYNGANYKVLYVGTGKYLGTSDLTNTAKQTIYAIKDNWDEVSLGDVRAATNPAMVVQTATAGVSSTNGDHIITGTAHPVNWTTGIGWYMDLIGSGERVTVNPLIVLNALYVGTNVPNQDACSAGGNSWLYKLDISTGTALSTAPEGAVAVSLGNVLIVGMTNVQLTSKTVATVVTKSDGTVSTVVGTQPGTNGPIKKTSWRVLN